MDQVGLPAATNGRKAAGSLKLIVVIVLPFLCLGESVARIASVVLVLQLELELYRTHYFTMGLAANSRLDIIAQVEVALNSRLVVPNIVHCFVDEKCAWRLVL